MLLTGKIFPDGVYALFGWQNLSPLLLCRGVHQLWDESAEDPIAEETGSDCAVWVNEGPPHSCWIEILLGFQRAGQATLTASTLCCCLGSNSNSCAAAREIPARCSPGRNSEGSRCCAEARELLGKAASDAVEEFLDSLGELVTSCFVGCAGSAIPGVADVAVALQDRSRSGTESASALSGSCEAVESGPFSAHRWEQSTLEGMRGTYEFRT
mmetsp:Transcript_134751/g.247623  ORF Transcript_134751/g.247623 Transcript_134751/m.247623 type:complete len:212 (-) Transcript_134751:108-743(-)